MPNIVQLNNQAVLNNLMVMFTKDWGRMRCTVDHTESSNSVGHDCICNGFTNTIHLITPTNCVSDTFLDKFETLHYVMLRLPSPSPNY